MVSVVARMSARVLVFVCFTLMITCVGLPVVRYWHSGRQTLAIAVCAGAACGSLFLAAGCCLLAHARAVERTHEALPTSEGRAAASRSRVLIVGGGFAGLAAARRLPLDFDVTLVDAKQFFEYTPGMCRPYALPSDHAARVLDYSLVCAKLGVEWLWAYVNELKDQHALVQPGDSIPSTQRTVEFDYCLVAVGCEYGLELRLPRSATPAKESLWIPTLKPEADGQLAGKAEASRFDERVLEGRRLHIEAEHARLSDLNARCGHVAVIGAGFVGVEYATELRYYFPGLEITIVDSRENCCSVMPPSARKYIQRHLDRQNIKSFYKINYDALMAPESERVFWDGLKLSLPELLYMSIGLRPCCRFLPSACLHSGSGSKPGGWIKVNQFLQVMSGADEQSTLAFGGRVFAVGNCVGAVPGVDALPKNVFPAEEMAANVALGLRGIQKGQPLRAFYWPWFAGLCAISLGPWDGVLVVSNRLPGSGFVPLWGPLVSLQKEIICRTKIDEFELGYFGWVWHLVHS